MFIVDSYSLAVIFCVVTMLCWGSWGNTQKLAGKTWRYELFYWDLRNRYPCLLSPLRFHSGQHGRCRTRFC